MLVERDPISVFLIDYRVASATMFVLQDLTFFVMLLIQQCVVQKSQARGNAGE